MFDFLLKYITGIYIIYCIALIKEFLYHCIMQAVITLYDYLLLPVYLLIFYLIVKRKSKKYKALGLDKTFIAAFWLRMAGAIGYALLIQYYYGYGDSFGYYQGGSVISRMMQQDLSSVKYLFASGKDVAAAAKAMGFGDDVPVSMPNDANSFIMKIAALLSYVTFNKYLLISVFFAFFSFIGIWKLFFVFYNLNKKAHVKLLAFFVLFFPSLWFWGSGLLKEPICVGCLGIVVYLFYKNFIEKRFSFFEIILSILLLIILTFVKGYITIILIISLIVALIYKGLIKIKNFIFRMMVTLGLLFVLVVAFISLDASTYIEFFVEDSYSQIQLFQNSYQSLQNEDDVGSKGAFLITDLSPSVQDILINSPVVIGSCLFRPFVWESKKIIIFFASLEALATLLITLYIFVKTKFFKFFIYIFSDAFLLFCFIFSILFALIVGYTTFNFGTLIRYKIIFLPFYYFLLIAIYTKYRTILLSRKIN